MSRARLASSTVTGQFRMRFLARNSFELLLRRAPDLSIKCSSLVRSFNFGTRKLCLVVSYSGDKRVVNNIRVRVRLDGSGGVVVVEASKRMNSHWCPLEALFEN